MKNKVEQDEIFSSVEPPISYYSSSSNSGVTAIFSNSKIESYKKFNPIFTTFSKNSFSLCNTIMVPFIINEKTIQLDDNNFNKEINKSASLNKERSFNNMPNTKNKNKSSRSENKENNNLFGRTYSNNYNNTNYEKNPFFTGNKNLSTNYLIERKSKKVEFNLKKKNNNYESDNNKEIKEEIKEFIDKGQCRSYNINDIHLKTSSLKDENKKDKNNMNLKKGKKAKSKECCSQKKCNKKGKDKENSIDKKKTFFFKGQSKSYMEEVKKEGNQKAEKFRTTNNSTGKKNSNNYYFSNKVINTNFNENYFKIIINQNNDCDKIEEKDTKNKEKTDKKKKRKTDTKNFLKESSLSKGFKIQFNDKIFHKDSCQLNQGINILKERIKSKDLTNDNSSQDENINNNNRDIIRKSKTKRIIKKSKEKKGTNKDSDSEEKSKIETLVPNRRVSGFTFYQKFRRRDSDYSQSKTNKSIRIRGSKDKENISKSRNCIKNKKAKNSVINCLSKKEMEYLKNNLDGKDNIKRVSTVLRRKRSISLNLHKSKIKEVADVIKTKKSGEDEKNIPLSASKTKKESKKKKFNFEIALKKNINKMQFNLFSKDKFTNTEVNNSDYLKYTLNCMELILELDIAKQTRLKNKINFNFPKPKKKGIKKKIALFDLDETLVHCTGDINQKTEYQHAIEIKLPGKQAVKVGINLRPCWKQTLNLIKKLYHIVIYTASHQAYADSVLDFMDPKKKYFKYRLYRNNCSLIDIDGAKFYVKDLDILNQYYDLKDIVIVDNSVLSFAYHLHNGIPIVPYYDEDKDGSLYVVGLYLEHIFPEDDLREANRKQINLDSVLEEAKKEQGNIIDEESDEEEENSDNSHNSDKNNNVGKIKEESEQNKNIENKNISDEKIERINKRFVSHAPIFKRREKQELTQIKLMSQSKLMKMYYEVNDDATNQAQEKAIESNEDSKNSDKFINELNNLKLESNETDKNSSAPDDVEFDCKSDPGNLLFHLNNFKKKKIPEEDSDSDEEENALKRVNTIKAEDYYKDNKDKENKNINGKLQFIRSNFYNKFKI